MKNIKIYLELLICQTGWYNFEALNLNYRILLNLFRLHWILKKRNWRLDLTLKYLT